MDLFRGHEWEHKQPECEGVFCSGGGAACEAVVSWGGGHGRGAGEWVEDVCGWRRVLWWGVGGRVCGGFEGEKFGGVMEWLEVGAWVCKIRRSLLFLERGGWLR